MLGPAAALGQRAEAIADQKKLAEWAKAFPSVDAKAELPRAVQWAIDNKRQGLLTKRGLTRYLSNWFGRSQGNAERLTGGVREPRKFEPTPEQLKAEIVKGREAEEAGRA